MWDGVSYTSVEGASFAVNSLDVALVAPGARSPGLAFGEFPSPPLDMGMNFCLFNNAWNTNYPEW